MRYDYETAREYAHQDADYSLPIDDEDSEFYSGDPGMVISDETVSDKHYIIVRDNGENWATETITVGDYRGGIIAMIPYQSKEIRQYALAIAKQICDLRSRTHQKYYQHQ